MDTGCSFSFTSSTNFINDSCSDVVEGASINNRFTVEKRSGTDAGKCDFSVSVTPVMVDFKRLLQQQNICGKASGESLSVIAGVSIV